MSIELGNLENDTVPKNPGRITDSSDLEIAIEDGGLPSINPALRETQSEMPTPSKRLDEVGDISILESIPELPNLQHAISEPVTRIEMRKRQSKPISRTSLRFNISKPSTWLVRLPSCKPTFYCSICMENVLESDRFSFSGESCTHSFCRDCLGSHLAIHVREGQVRNPCPMVGADDCGNFATESDVEALCDPEVLERFQRFKKMKDNEDHRECPECNHMQLGNPKKPAITCEKCSFSYCFFHANAHPDVSCKAYAKRRRDDELATEREVRRSTKKCPSCKAPTQKNEGCNHMTCRQCNANWCWLCGKNMGSNYGKHYEWWNLCGCAGAQFQYEFSGLYVQLYKLFVVLVWLVAVPSCVAFGALFLALSPFTLAIACCLKSVPRHPCDFLEKLVGLPTACAAGMVTILVALAISLVLDAITMVIIILVFPFIWVMRKTRLSSFAPTNAQLLEPITFPFKIILSFFDNM